jgi:predicted nucleotidyltransferase
MAQSRASEIAQFFRECLKEKGLKVNKVILFGSQARGTATEESDIDIVIVSEEFRRKNIFRRAKLTRDGEWRDVLQYFNNPQRGNRDSH